MAVLLQFKVVLVVLVLPVETAAQQPYRAVLVA
jgi:hypothetical protein